MAALTAAASVCTTDATAIVLVFMNQTTIMGNDAPANTASSLRVTVTDNIRRDCYRHLCAGGVGERALLVSPLWRFFSFCGDSPIVAISREISPRGLRSDSCWNSSGLDRHRLQTLPRSIVSGGSCGPLIYGAIHLVGAHCGWVRMRDGASARRPTSAG